MADDEVAGLVEADLDAALALAAGDEDSVPARYASRTDSGVLYREDVLSRSELVPNYLALDQLYLRLFLAARRFVQGEREHLFW